MLKRVLVPIVLSALLCLPCRAAWDSDPISKNAAEIRALLRPMDNDRSALEQLSGVELGNMLARYTDANIGGALPAGSVDRLALCRSLQACSEQRGFTVFRCFSEGGSAFAEDVSRDDYPLLSQMEQLGIISPRRDGLLYASDIVCRVEGAASVVRYFSLPRALVDKPNEPVSSCRESGNRDVSVLDGCCLIGHSHAVGMQMALGLEGMDVMAVNGMSAVAALGSGDFPLPDGSVGYIAQGLAMRSYRTVYLLLGTNDMPGGSWNLSNYIESMRSIISLVKTRQPQARIVLLSIAPVGAMYADMRPEIATDIIPAYNQALKSLSRDCRVDYLDIYTVLADKNDLIRAEYGNGIDGLHFNPAGYQAILDIMLEHA